MKFSEIFKLSKTKLKKDKKKGKEKDASGEEVLLGEDPEELDDDPLPPPPEEDKELLFLIEFLVDTLTLFPENMRTEKIDPCALQGPSSVTLTFLHFPPMDIGEKDIDSEKMTGGNVVQFNAGKSLMFALTESQFEDPPPVYLVVSACKDMPHAFRFPKLVIGKTKIQLSELFRQVFEKYDENPQKSVSKSIKDKYELIGEKNKPAAEITIYIRLTCLGENIVTEFQTGETSDEPLLFKNKESKKVYECKTTEKSEDSPGKTIPGWGDDKNKPSCVQERRVVPPDPEDENFEEIFAEINGSAVRVKVEKSDRREIPKEFHISEFCDCNIPLPQNLVAGMSDLSLSLASEGSMNFETGKAVKMDKKVGLNPANQLFFPVPPAENLAQAGPQNCISYSVRTCRDGDKHGHKGQSSYRIVTDNNPDGPPPAMPNDPEKDVFVFKIIKRGRKDKGKNALELEFKTPKDKIELAGKPHMREIAVGPGKSKKKDKKKKKKKKAK